MKTVMIEGVECALVWAIAVDKARVQPGNCMMCPIWQKHKTNERCGRPCASYYDTKTLKHYGFVPVELVVQWRLEDKLDGQAVL